MSFFPHFSQGFDPHAKGKFQPRRRAKGGSSTGSLLRRKRKVAHEQQRVGVPPPRGVLPPKKKFRFGVSDVLLSPPKAVIRQSVEQREQQQKQSRTGPPLQRTALDRFKKQG